MTDSDISLHTYSHSGVYRAWDSYHVMSVYSIYRVYAYTCHGDVADGHQVGDGHGEQGQGVHGGDQEGEGEDHHGCDDVDKMVGTEDHHQSVKTCVLKLLLIIVFITCRNICEDISLRR